MVDIVIPVGPEPGRVKKDARVRAECTKVLAGLRLHDKRAPSTAIFSTLICQAFADRVETVRLHARDMRASPRVVLHRQSNGQRRDKVDIADVDKKLPAVVRKFTESEIRVTIWIGWVEDRGLYKTGSRVDEELQRFAE